MCVSTASDEKFIFVKSIMHWFMWER